MRSRPDEKASSQRDRTRERLPARLVAAAPNRRTKRYGGGGAKSQSSQHLRPRLEQADRVGTSICPFCAVGCAQLVYAKNGKPIHVEGDPRSPVNQGTLCPKGAGTLGMMLLPDSGSTTCCTAHPTPDRWERKPLDWAMEQIAQRVKRTRDETFIERFPDDTPVNHTLGHRVAGRRHAGQRRKLPDQEAVWRRPGVVNIENQAGSDTPPRYPVWGRHLDEARRAWPCGTWPTPTDHGDGLQYGGEPSGGFSLRHGGEGSAAPRSCTSIRASLAPRRWRISMRRSGPVPTSRSWAGSFATSWRTTSGSATSRSLHQSSRRSSRTAIATPRTMMACSPAFDAITRSYTTDSWQYKDRGSAVAVGRAFPAMQQHDAATACSEHDAASAASDDPRCNIRTASIRSCADTCALHAGDGGARDRLSAGDRSCASAMHSPRTRGASGPGRSATRSAGHITRTACRSSAPPRSSRACSGNIGRPGGGMMALRGHCSIQGSTDIPTLYNMLPTYLPQPNALQPHQTLKQFLEIGNPADRLVAQFPEIHDRPAEGVVRRRCSAG